MKLSPGASNSDAAQYNFLLNQQKFIIFIIFYVIFDNKLYFFYLMSQGMIISSLSNSWSPERASSKGSEQVIASGSWTYVKQLNCTNNAQLNSIVMGPTTKFFLFCVSYSCKEIPSRRPTCRSIGATLHFSSKSNSWKSSLGFINYQSQ